MKGLYSICKSNYVIGTNEPMPIFNAYWTDSGLEWASEANEVRETRSSVIYNSSVSTKWKTFWLMR